MVSQTQPTLCLPISKPVSRATEETAKQVHPTQDYLISMPMVIGLIAGLIGFALVCAAAYFIFWVCRRKRSTGKFLCWGKRKNETGNDIYPPDVSMPIVDGPKCEELVPEEDVEAARPRPADGRRKNDRGLLGDREGRLSDVEEEKMEILKGST